MQAIGHPRGIRMTDVIGKLTAEQALEIVERLCRKGGDIRDAVVAEAMNLLTQFSLEETADEVFDALDLIDVQDCFDQAESSHEGDTSPREAALDIFEEELQPFFDQVERYHELGMGEQEATYCMAVVLGIYRFVHESKSEFKKLAAEIPADCAGDLLEEDLYEDWAVAAREQARDMYVRVARCLAADAHASGDVPTTHREDVRFKKWWARRKSAFAHPTDLRVWQKRATLRGESIARQ